MGTEKFIPCSIKLLPENDWIPAAQSAININPYNAPAVNQLSRAMPGVVLKPEHLALLTSKWWGNAGVSLTVGFMDDPPANLRARILSHMNAWGLFSNVHFSETNHNPQVRIARKAGDGYWSYLGTDVLSIPGNEPTMNLESFSMNTPDSEFFRVIRHETGHTLGFPHEHVREEIINRIDREKAIAYFMRTQGWSKEDVIAQVLTPIAQSALIATQTADINSIMCYWLPAEIMKNSIAVPGGNDIDLLDAQFAAMVYPKAHQTAKSSPAIAVFKSRLWVAFTANNNTNNVLICSSADGQIWSGNTPIHQAAKGGTSSALTVFKSKLWIALVANNNTNDILICSSSDGLTWTQNIPVHQAAKVGSSPSLIVFKNKLYVSFVANNATNNILVCSSADGISWSGNLQIHQAVKSGSSPALIVFKSKIWISFIAKNNTNGILVCSSSDGQTWGNNVPVNQEAKEGSSVALALFKKKLFASFIANNDTNSVLVTYTTNGKSWANNTPVNQAAKANTSTSLTVFKSKLWVAFIANNNTNNILVCSTDDGQHWTNNVPV